MKLLLATIAASLAAAPAIFASGSRAEMPHVAPPVIHENISIFLLKGASSQGATPKTLAEALEAKAVEVHETGNVRELKIENKGEEPVFVQMGDIVKGGRQDRVLTVSLLLPPKSGLLPIGALCVEQGRWSARGAEDAKRFGLSEALLPSRNAKMAIAKPAGPDLAEEPPPQLRAVRTPIEAELNAAHQRDAARVAQQRSEGSRRGYGQSEVWRNVDELQRLLSSSLSTTVANDRSRTSLQLSLENDALKKAQAGYVAALEPTGIGDENAIGVVVAIGGRIASADLYPSNGLFRKMWPKLVRAAATEAIALKTDLAANSPSIEAITSFLSEPNNGRRSERAVGALATIESLESDKVLSVSARTPKGDLIHRSYLAK